jgi:hypothetical protein
MYRLLLARYLCSSWLLYMYANRYDASSGRGGYLGRLFNIGDANLYIQTFILATNSEINSSYGFFPTNKVHLGVW